MTRSEYTSTGEVAVDDRENLTDRLWELERDHPDRPALAHRVGDTFEEWSTRRFVAAVRGVAKGLVASGIEPGDRVCVHSATRHEWSVLDFAIWAAGGVTVPIYETSSAEQIEWIVSDSGAVMVITESAALEALVRSATASIPACREVVVIEDAGVRTLTQRGEGIDDGALLARARQVTGADIATIVYTSGTTGRPKGCVITHHSFIWDATQVEHACRTFFHAGQRTLLFLPLAHIFARVIQTSCVRAGVTLGYSTGIPQLVEELGMFRPDFVLAVPRVFEKVYNRARQKAHDEGKGRIFDKAVEVAEEFSRQSERGRVTLGLKVLHGVFDRLVYVKLRAALGGRASYAVSGGAALGDRLGHFFTGIGVVVLEGYGLTETTAGACINRPEARRVGTVGKPVPGSSVRIAEDGEVLIKGPHVFAGYYRDPAATAEVMTEDGWFRSGDLGSLDGEGYLRITGRKKEIIITAGGKNVAPAVLEDRLRAHALISQAMVVGDGRPFIAALVTIDPEAFPAWTEAQGRPGRRVAEAVADADLIAAVQEAVDDANLAVSKAEAIRSFRILPEDFTVGDELSQKMSVKRHVVGEKHRALIDAIYASR